MPYGQYVDIGQSAIEEDVHVVYDGVWSQTQEPAIVDMDTEGQVDGWPDQIHGLVVSNVQGTSSVSYHVVKQNSGPRVPGTGQYCQLSLAINL